MLLLLIPRFHALRNRLTRLAPGDGVKTIVNGVLDGWIAAIVAAGDETATDDTTTTTGQ